MSGGRRSIWKKRRGRRATSFGTPLETPVFTPTPRPSRMFVPFTRMLASTALAVVVIGCAGERSATAPRLLPLTGAMRATGVDPASGASLTTNKDDYAPGEVVHLTGAGWAAGETVHLDMSEVPNTHADVVMDVQADSSGAFSVHFYDVQTHDLGVTFTLVATGGT